MGADIVVIRWPGVLGELVADVFTSGLLVNKAVTLFITVFYPVEPRVYCLVTLLLDSVIRNSGSILVVCLYGSVRLGTTKLIQGGTNGDCLRYIEEECPNVCFCYRYKNILDDGGVDMDGTLDRWSGI